MYIRKSAVLCRVGNHRPVMRSDPVPLRASRVDSGNEKNRRTRGRLDDTDALMGDRALMSLRVPRSFEHEKECFVYINLRLSSRHNMALPLRGPRRTTCSAPAISAKAAAIVLLGFLCGVSLLSGNICLQLTMCRFCRHAHPEPRAHHL